MKRFSWLSALMCCLILFSACAAPQEISETPQPHIMGATYMTRNNPYFDVLHEAIETVVEGNGDILISRDPCQDQEKQNDQILEMIDENIEVLFLNPVDWEAVFPALQACREAGVIVINVDTAVKDTEYVVSIIETDNYQAGVLCAEDLMQRISEGNILILGNPGQMSIMHRIEGFLDTVANRPQYEVEYIETSQGEFEVSAQVVGELLDRDGGQCRYDAILGGNDPSALGALAALQQRQLDENVLIYGIDGSPDFKALLEQGYVTATSAQSPKELGRVAAETAYAYLRGETVESYISITPYLITRENFNAYEIDEWQ